MVIASPLTLVTLLIIAVPYSIWLIKKLVRYWMDGILEMESMFHSPSIFLYYIPFTNMFPSYLYINPINYIPHNKFLCGLYKTKSNKKAIR